MLAVSTYLLVCCRTLLRHVLIPSGIIQKYGASGELWSIRLILLVLGFGALLIANFVAPHVDILQAATQLIVVLMAPLLAMLVLAVFIPRSITHIYVAPLSGVTLAIIVLYMLRAHTTLPQYAIISLMSFGVTLLIGVLINLVHPK